MKIKRFLMPLLLLISCITVFSACTKDPYKNYNSSGLEVKPIPLPLNYFDSNIHKFGYNKIVIFTDYESYAAYDFNLDYNKSYFELNNLVVFAVSCCSSDGMDFGELLENGGKLYPLFYRMKIGHNEPVTEDFIVLRYCAELSKSSNYKAGEIVYRYY